MRLEVHETQEFRRPCETTFVVPTSPEGRFVGDIGGRIPVVSKFFLLLGIGAEGTEAVKNNELGLDDFFCVDESGLVTKASGQNFLLRTRWGGLIKQVNSFVEVELVNPI